MKFFRYLLIFVPLSFAVHFYLQNFILDFIVASAGLIALSVVLNDAIEALAYYVGTTISAVLNATFSNTSELILAIVALLAGHIGLVKGALMGAVLGNLLVVPGLAMIFGGFRHGLQKFSSRHVGRNTTMMTLSVIGFLIPTFVGLFHGETSKTLLHGNDFNDPTLFTISISVGLILLIVYLAGVIFSIRSGTATYEQKPEKPTWSLFLSLSILIGATLLTAFLSEYLVGDVEVIIKNFHINEVFIGVILIPLVGDIAEHVVGIQQGIENKMELALSISMESAAQIVLFVAPILVLLSLFVGKHFILSFDPMELIILGLGVLVAVQVTSDGESNWLEGLQLLSIYLLTAIGLFLL